MTSNSIYTVLEVVAVLGAIVLVQVWNANRVDFDEFERSYQTALLYLGARFGISSMIPQKKPPDDPDE